MNLLSIARPYAKAAFETALETQAIELWCNTLGLAAELLEQEEVRTVFLNPNVTEEQLYQSLVELLSINNEMIKRFVHLLVDYHRATLLPEIFTEFVRFKDQHERSVKVEVASAFPLSESQELQIKQALTKRFSKDILLTTRVDQSILGGAIIRADDLVIDGSVQGRLEKLREHLKGDQL